MACEFSGVVRDAFIARGHAAISADLLPSERPGPHFEGDVRAIIDNDWDLMIAFPPCTHLAVSGARWWPGKVEAQREALDFVAYLLQRTPWIPRVAIENPIGIISSRIAKPTQIIQPWQFGHGESKATCLWLQGLPPLQPTNIVGGRTARVHMTGETKDRWKRRSRTYQGIADAMAAQWSNP